MPYLSIFRLVLSGDALKGIAQVAILYTQLVNNIITLEGPVENPQLVEFVVSPSFPSLPQWEPGTDPFSLHGSSNECSPSINTSLF